MRSHRVPRPGALIARTSITVRRARRQLRRQRDSRSAAAVDPGHRAAAKPEAQSSRRAASARSVEADGWMFDGEDALGRLSTMSLDNQRSLKLALSRTRLPESRRTDRRRNEPVGDPILRPHDHELGAARFRPGSSGRADCTWTTGTCVMQTARLFSIHRRPDILSSQYAALQRTGASLVLCTEIQTAEEAAVDEIISIAQTHLGLPASAVKVACW